jgi:hypothetical protein
MNDDIRGPIEKLTDTHYNSRDGDGEFNWRIIFNTKLPTIIQFYKL